MKLAQLKTLTELVRHNCNVTRTAHTLHTAQSAISRQIQLLEDELGSPLFHRRGKRLVKPTALCSQVLDQIAQIQRSEANIRALAVHSSSIDSGVIRIGTTHTQARFFLPSVVALFRQQFPKVKVVIEQAVPQALVRLLRENQVDLAICTEAIGDASDLVTHECYTWTHALVCTKTHPLAHSPLPLRLDVLSKHDLITYTHQFAGGSHIRATFSQAGLQAPIVLAAADSDVIKTYVRLGLGAGIIASMSVNPNSDTELLTFPVGHLFGTHSTCVAWHSGAVLPSFVEQFKGILISEGKKLAAQLPGSLNDDPFSQATA